MNTQTTSVTQRWLASGLLVALLFFDVLLLGASLQPSNIGLHLGAPPTLDYTGLFAPDHPLRQPHHGLIDIGASAYHSEPARHFMATQLQAGNWPLWNPYSASGNLATNTLSDIKASPLTLFSAGLFNASAASHDWGHLLLFWLAAMAVISLCTRYWQLPLLAATTAAGIFLLNGFASANLGSQHAQAYLYGPILLWSLVAWLQRPDALRYAIAVVCQAALLLNTMIPVALTTLLAVYALAGACCLDRHGLVRVAIRPLLMMASIPFAGLLLAAFVWFPILASLLDGSLLGHYSSNRQYSPYPLDNLINILSPHHFWENYNGLRPRALLDAAGVRDGGLLLPHTGIIAAGLAGCAIGLCRQGPQRWLTATALGLLLAVYGRYFGLWPLSWLADLPPLNIISHQYWGPLSGLSLTVLAALGLRRVLVAGMPFGWLLPLGLLAWAVTGLYLKLGWPQESPWRGHLTQLLTVAAFLATVAILLHRRWLHPTVGAWLLAVACLLELYSYTNTLRPQRFSYMEAPPPAIHFLQQEAAATRVLGIGTRNTLVPEYGSAFGIRETGSYLSNALPWYADLHHEAFGIEHGMFLITGTRAESRMPPRRTPLLHGQALDMMSIGYISVARHAGAYADWLTEAGYPLAFQSPQTLVFRNDNAFPLAYLTPALAHGAPLFKGQHPNHDLRQLTLTEDKALLAAAQALGIPATASPVNAGSAVLLEQGNRIHLQVQAAAPAIVVITDSWHPAWQARLNGKPVVLGRVNRAFKGIAVPAGSHELELHLILPSWHWGRVVSLLMLAAVGLLMLSGSISGRREKTPSRRPAPMR